MSLDVETIRAARPKNQLHYHVSIGSTMTAASQLVQEGAPHGTVVVADEQTAGLGRLGRSWISDENAGIYCSILLRLPLPPDKLPIASLLVGLATAEAIEKATGLACDLRWPNDVLIGSQKVAGILPQLINGCIVAGIGINVNNRAFPPDLRSPATSLFLAGGGRLHSRELLLVQLLESIDAFVDLLAEGGPEEILRAFTAASSYVNQRRVMVEEDSASGITAGLDAYGFLLLRTDDGTLHRISAGGVRPDESPAND